MTYHRLRRALGTLLLLLLAGLPFLQVRGESVFRFDIPTLRLFFFGGAIGLADSFIVLVVLIFATFLALFATTLFGRLWCGWLCPQTVLSDATVFMERRKGGVPRVAAIAGGLGMSVLIAVSLTGYFVSPWDIPETLRAGGPAGKILAGSWFALTVLLFLDLALLRRKFCATVCPYAKLQGVLFDDRTLLVAFDNKRSAECMDCRACITSCPVSIDIREGAQSACIHCAECIDACSGRMAVHGKQSLIFYSFGTPGVQKIGQRVNPLITGVMTFLSLILLVWLLSSKMPFDVNVRLSYTGDPERRADGSVTNIYELSFRNMTPEDLEMEIAVGYPGATISPQRIVLRRGQDLTRIPAALTLKAAPAGTKDLMLPLIVRSRAPDKSVSLSVHFLLPLNR